MEGEVAKKNLYEAVTTTKEFEAATFIKLLKQDPYLVDVASFACSRNILHIATMHGQEGMVAEITTRHPQLAQNLDSQKSSPLHIAAEKGYVEIATTLLGIAPEMCWWRDGQGMNPIHIAAVNGHKDILEKMANMESWPEAAMEKSDRGQSLLHLCLKHRKLEALQYLVERKNELVDVEDDDGDTVLHSAVRLKRVEFVEYLVNKHKTYELPTNSKGQTVQQISRQSSPDQASRQIDKILSKRISHSGKPVSFLGWMSDITMVVVVLIAAMAFQAVVSPAGGVWQDNDDPSHKIGEAVMATTRPKIFENFIQANKVAFASSLVTIILLTTGLPSQNIFFTMAALCSMWLSLACIGISYVASALAITPNKETESITHVIHVIIVVFLIMYAMFCLSSLVTFRSRIMAYSMAHKWRKNQQQQPAAAAP